MYTRAGQDCIMKGYLIIYWLFHYNLGPRPSTFDSPIRQPHQLLRCVPPHYAMLHRVTWRALPRVSLRRVIVRYLARRAATLHATRSRHPTVRSFHNPSNVRSPTRRTAHPARTHLVSTFTFPQLHKT
ncbi:hypothetical protein B0H12DRAFT_142713 [Mycena haematopus]|nr:hypothetical protein B0H12DRAFT_142713 [Mycena haematopus]